MSEVITETEPPKNLDEFSSLQIVEYNDKHRSKHLYGIIDDGGKVKRKHLKQDDLLEAYGHDPKGRKLHIKEHSEEYKQYREDPEAWHKMKMREAAQARNERPEVQEELLDVEPEPVPTEGRVIGADDPGAAILVVEDEPAEASAEVSENHSSWRNRLQSWRERSSDLLSGRRVYTGFVNRNVDGQTIREEVTVELEGDNRRTIAGVALGVLAVGVAFWLGTKYGTNGAEAIRDNIQNIEVDITDIKITEDEHSAQHEQMLENQEQSLENDRQILDNQEVLLENDRQILENQAEMESKIENIQAILDPNGAEPGNAITVLDSEIDKLNEQVQNLKETTVQGGGGGGQSSANYEIGQTFKVESGNGLSQEIQQYAVKNGYGNISGDKAYKIYLELHSTHGTNLIDLVGTPNDTYTSAYGDVRISAPGKARFPDAVEKDLIKLLKR